MSTPPSTRRNSTLVASGILLSRVSGLVRQRAFGHFFGTGGMADAYTAAFRIPNLMQNLLGEGVLSASFIPVHSRLLKEGRTEEAGRVAGAVAGLLALLAGVITLIAVVFADPLTSLLAPGFSGARRDLTVTLVRVLTPGVGFLVLSAWCLGVLNSHRRFFLSYVAPVLWNVVQIVVLVGTAVVVLDDPLAVSGAAPDALETLLVALGIGTLIGGLAQFLVQVPTVRRLEPGLRLSLRRDLPGVRSTIRAFGPVVAGRGVVQLSAYLDLFLASLLVEGAVAALGFAQVLYLLPVSLFGMSVAAAELPELSTADHDDKVALGRRLDTGLARIGFYVLLSAIVLVVVGDLAVGTLFRSGDFGRDSELVVWAILIAYGVALLPITSSRLLQSALYGVGDTKTPARIAVVRVVVSATVGLLVMFPLDRLAIVDGGIDQTASLFVFGPLPLGVREAADTVRLGAMGLAIGGAIGAWVEYRALRRAVAETFEVRTQVAGQARGHLVLPAVAAVVTGLLMRPVVADWPRLLGGPLAIGAVALAYVLVAARTRVDEVDDVRRAVGAVTGRLGTISRLQRSQRRRRNQ